MSMETVSAQYTAGAMLLGATGALWAVYFLMNDHMPAWAKGTPGVLLMLGALLLSKYAMG